MFNHSGLTRSISRGHRLHPALIPILRYDEGFKRALDIIIATLCLPIVLPIIMIMCLIVRRDGGCALFGHKRIGRYGNAFSCLKIRTMVPDAQARLETLLETDPRARADWDRNQKLDVDPRVTAIGDILRRTSLDELPQIWNVFKGEMSFVGPRPVTEAELVRYGESASAYKALRPGITGLWQVSGRNDVSYHERVAFDVVYYRTISAMTDLKILLCTFSVVMAKTGR